MVERNLAKVEVASSNLVSRSRYKKAAPRAAFLYLELARLGGYVSPGWQPRGICVIDKAGGYILNPIVGRNEPVR